MPRFLIDDQGRTSKKLKPLDISPTIRREMHGNEPRVVEPIGWEYPEIFSENITKEGDDLTEKTPFKYVSLFSGIGGFEQALNKLGGTCVLASEIDKFANKAYEVLYGETTVGDITEVDARNVPDHDLLVGGFPCQAFSVAGKRGGFDDARGTLFFEVARIASQKQPSVLLLENVKGLVSHDKGKTLDTIVKTLNDIGYRVDFEILNSKFFGVPQNRERIFIVAVREDLVENEPWDIEGTTIIPKGKRRISGYEDVKTFNFVFPQNDEVTTRLRDVLESSVDEKYYLSEEKTAKLVAQLNEASGLGKDGKQRVYSTEGISPTVPTGAGGNHEPKVAEQVNEEEVRPVLTPDRLTKRQNGRRFKEDGEESFTLTTQDRHGIAEGISPQYKIRKLTPLECFRLQGFPDSAHQKLVDAGISDSQRYKMAGNAVTVNVIEAIGANLLPLLERKEEKGELCV